MYLILVYSEKRSQKRPIKDISQHYEGIRLIKIQDQNRSNEGHSLMIASIDCQCSVSVFTKYLDITNIWPVADIGTENIVKQIKIGATFLEYAKLGEGAAHIKSDELQRLFPAELLLAPRPSPRGLKLVSGPLGEDSVELRVQVKRVGQTQPPDPSSNWGRETSPPQ